MLRVALVIDDYNELIYLQTILRKIGIDVEGLQNVKKYSELSLGFNPQVLIASAYGKKVQGLEFCRNLHRVRGLPKIILLQSPSQLVPEKDVKNLNIDLLLESPVNPMSLIAGLAAVANVDETILNDKFKRLQASGALNIPEPIQMVGEDEATIHETPRFAFRDQGQTQAAPSFKIKTEINSAIDDPIKVAELRAQSLTGAQINSKANEPKDFVFPANGNKSGISHSAIEQSDGDKEKRRNRFERFVSQAPALNKDARFDRQQILQFNKKIRSAPPPPDMDQIEGDRKEFVKNLFTKKKD